MQHIDSTIAAGVLGTTPEEIRALSAVIGAPLSQHRGELRIEREALDQLYAMLYGTPHPKAA